MSEYALENLNRMIEEHDELMEERKWMPLDELWDIDRKIIKYEELILEELARHPELADEYDTSYFFLEW